MLYPTSYLKSKGLGKAGAPITDSRFSGGTSGRSIGHVAPKAASGGLLGLVQDGDRIEIDIPARSVMPVVSKAALTARRAARNKAGWKPARPRARYLSDAQHAFALFATSAATGAMRQVPDLD